MEQIRSFFMLLLIAVLFTSITYNVMGIAITPGLDPSWMFALNYFPANNILIGSTVFFTSGPLGFINFPMPISEHLLISAIFWYIAKLLLAFILLVLSFQIHKDKSYKYKAFIVLTIFIFLATLDNCFLLSFLSLTFLLLFNRFPHHLSLLILSIIVATTTFLMKPGDATYAIAAIYSYIIIYTFYHRNYRILCITLVVQILSYFILWLAIQHTLQGSINYLIVTHQLIKGNTLAMSINPHNNWWLISIFIAAIFATASAFKGTKYFDNSGYFYYIIQLALIFIAFKYAYGREDGHINFLLHYLLSFFLYSITIIGSAKRASKFAVCYIIAMLFQFANQHHVGLGGFSHYSLYGVNQAKNNLINYQQRNKELQQISAKSLTEIKLSNKTLTTIGSHTVDVYPYDLTVIAANSFNWKPRPIIQSYVSYLPELDKRNADFFSDKDKQPSFLVFSFEEIDGKYLLNSEPLTIYQILKWYKPIEQDKKYSLLIKQNRPRLSEPELINATQVQWDQWVSVPKATHDIIRAHVTAYPKLAQKVKELLYKRDDVWIDYKLSNGDIATYRLILENAKNGIWIKPFLQNSTHEIIGSVRKLVTLPPSQTINSHHVIDDLIVADETIIGHGWAFLEGMDTTNQSVNIILASNNDIYTLPTAATARKDVSKVFENLKFNFDNSGISFAASNKDINPGNYKVYIYLKNQDKQVLIPTDHTIKISKMSKNLVTQIRLRHSKYDFFSKELAISWYGFNKLTNEDLLKP